MSKRPPQTPQILQSPLERATQRADELLGPLTEVIEFIEDFKDQIHQDLEDPAATQLMEDLEELRARAANIHGRFRDIALDHEDYKNRQDNQNRKAS